MVSKVISNASFSGNSLLPVPETKEGIEMKGLAIVEISVFATFILLLLIASSVVESYIIEVQPNLENVSVYPSTSNMYDQLFNYTVTCTFLNEVNILLEVYNLSDQEWRAVGYRTYEEGPDPQKLNWSSKICSGECEGLSWYRFKYNDVILLTKQGPAITKIKKTYGGGGGGGYYGSWITYTNATVDPNWVSIGLRDEKKTFNYSVIVDNDATLILRLYNQSNNEWVEFGEGKKTKTKSERLHEWTVNLTLDENWYGICKYQFYPKEWKDEASQIYYGPEIKSKEERMMVWKEDIGISDKRLKKPIIECTVMPKEERWFKKYTYTALINHPDRVNMTVALFVYKPGSKDWEFVPWKPYKDNAIISEDNYENGAATVKWTSEGIFDKTDVNKPPYEYYIWFYDGYNEGKVYFTGPEDVTENQEPTVIGIVRPEKGTIWTPFKYTASISDMNADDTVYISLYVKNPSDKAVLIGEETVTIRGGDGNATWVVPSNEYPERIFTTENIGNKSFNSSFYFEYSDEGMEIMGSGKNTSDTIPGPDVKPANVAFINATVSPETGKYSDNYTYKAEFYTAESNTITATLRIYDPSNPSEYENFITKEVNGTGHIYISWQEVSPDVFGPDDFNKTGKYSIVWRDKRLQMKEKEEGPWSGPHINNGIPILGGVALPLALIILVPLVIPSMLFLSPFFRKTGFDAVKNKDRKKGEEINVETEIKEEEIKKEEAKK